LEGITTPSVILLQIGYLWNSSITKTGNMYNGLLHTHSFLRWILLILLLVAIYKSIADKKGTFTASHKKIGMFTMICADLLLLIGLYQWAFGKTWGLVNIKELGFSGVMKVPAARFFAVEHLLGMLIAIILIHTGYSYAKKSLPDAVKHRRAILFYGLSLLIILISIPWPFREIGAGRSWLPGM